MDFAYQASGARQGTGGHQGFGQIEGDHDEGEAQLPGSKLRGHLPEDVRRVDDVAELAGDATLYPMQPQLSPLVDELLVERARAFEDGQRFLGSTGIG